jgi:serine/threonine protein kinase
MGSVYKALDITLNSTCAIKELSPPSGNTQRQKDAKEWFYREAKILAGLDHANLPKVYDYFVTNNRYYLVMNFIDGEDLETILEREGKPGLPEEKIIEWSKQILKVLDYLHNQSPPVIYRDLKPSNIMLHKDGRAMLIDFGIARTVNQGSNTQKTAIGTLGYISEEQCQGEPEPRSDIYSLGATMHHLITGEKPLPFKLEPIKNIISGISPGLEHVVMKAVNNKISQRYKDAKAMLVALEMIEKQKSNPRFTRKIWKILTSRKVILSIIICFFLLFIVTGVAIYNVSRLYSSDWKVKESGTVENLNRVYFADINNGWTAGDNGIILQTVDSGETWKKQESNLKADIKGIYFSDSMRGWAIGKEWKKGKCQGVILLTGDGGITWEKKDGKNSENFEQVDMVDINNAWASGESGKIFHITSDGLWKKFDTESSGTFDQVSFINPLEGWISLQVKTGKNEYSGRILHTTDGGKSWNSQNIDDLTTITGLDFIDSNNGWVTGFETKKASRLTWAIFHTTDGGITWKKQYSEGFICLYNIQFLNKYTGWVMGLGKEALFGLGISFLSTTDGGVTWKKENSLYLTGSDFYFADPFNGWVVGKKGKILKHSQ